MTAREDAGRFTAVRRGWHRITGRFGGRGAGIPEPRLPAVPPSKPSAFHRTWHELVQRPAKIAPRPRTGEFYDRMAALPKPLHLVEPNPDYRGGRANRAPGVFTSELSLRFGEARTRQHRAKHPVRQAQRMERAKARATAKQAQALALLAALGVEVK